METVRFEPLIPDRVPLLAGMCDACLYWEDPQAFAARLPKEGSLARKAQWLAAHPEAGGIVAYVGGAPAGFVLLGPAWLFPRAGGYPSGPPSADAAFVACLFVSSTARARGLGRALVQAAEGWAQARRYPAVETFARAGDANNPSGPLALWERCGYRVIRAADAFPLVRKDLSPPA